MTEAIELPQNYEVELELPTEEESDVEENPLFGAGTKNLFVEVAEYGIGAMAGFAISDLASAKLETTYADYFTANPSVWFAIPIVKFIAGGALIWGTHKVRGADLKRFLLGFALGLFADVANDLIVAFQVDTSLGIERKVFVPI